MSHIDAMYVLYYGTIPVILFDSEANSRMTHYPINDEYSDMRSLIYRIGWWR